ncbi:YodC family protein [Rahnella inusitata]|uniref:YodC family protein n=1 Tax=Rahnella inusitata TaxID=58169 RepID=UPI0039BE05AF
MTSTFAVGDLVKLKSGGPDMTVQEIIERNDAYSYWCQWFAGRKLERGLFSQNSLDAV